MLRHALPDEAREYVLGDLDEEFAARAPATTRRRLVLWYWSQTVRSIVSTQRQELDMATPAAPPDRPSFVASIAHDVRESLRTLRHARGYTIAAVLTLALGIGTSVAIFSAVNEVMLRPLRFAEPDRLAMLWESNAERDWHQVHAAPANVLDWRTRAKSFSGIGFFSDFPSAVSLGGGREPGQVALAQVSGNLFDVLGASPLHGRTFREDETYESGLVVLSHGLWQRQFGGDPALVGQSIRLDGRAYQVLGVMGPDFEYSLADADAWTPMAFLAQRRGTVWFRRAHVVRAVGRLAPGVSFAQAAAELEAISRDLEREFPDTNTGMRGGLTPLKAFLVGDDRRTTLLLLLGAVVLLQLIACANVANLTLARAVGRRQELSLRAALGAARGRLTRFLFTESAVLAAAGTAIGLALGAGGLALVAAMAPPELDGLVFRLDWRLAFFAVGLGALSALVFGAWPAMRASRVQMPEVLADGSRTGSTRRRLFAANAFVAVEVALAVLLVASAGLMVRSLDRLRTVADAAAPPSVLTFRIQPAAGTYPTADARVRFGEALAERVATIPGVSHVGISRGLPLTGYGWTSDFTIDRWPPDRFGIDVRHREATAGYFTALGIRVLDGRLFEAADLAPGRNVPVVVNRAFAERYFPGESPVGRRVVFDRQPTERSYWYPIVGVVEDERRTLTGDPLPEIIAHIYGDTPNAMTFVARTTVPPASVLPSVRQALAALDRETPLLQPRTMEEVARASRARERFVMVLLVVFAVAALALSVVGVYGVASQASRARTREVGIRLALGAQPASVVRSLIGRSALFVGAGLAIGLAAALAAGQLLSSFLFQVSPRDPATLAIVTVVIAAAALVATMVPSWRAVRGGEALRL